MSRDLNLMDLWQQQPIRPSSLTDLMAKLTQFKRANLRRLWLINGLLIATSGFIGLIWSVYHPQLVTTKVGIVLTIIAMVTYLAVYNKYAVLNKEIDSTQSVDAYLQALILLKTKQHYLQSKLLSGYFVLLSVGIGLYLYEYTRRMSLFGALLSYALTGLWIVFNWVYIRPRTIKKQGATLDELIREFTRLHNQLTER